MTTSPASASVERGKACRRGLRSVPALAVALLALLAGAGSAAAAPAWEIVTAANTHASPGGTLQYYVTTQNVGDVDTDGTPIELGVTLAPGLTVNAVTPVLGPAFDCSSVVPGSSSFTCPGPDSVGPGGLVRVIVTVDVDPGASGLLTSSFEVSGGGATASASTVDPTIADPAPPAFGIDAFDGQVTANAAGDPFTQAGGHPFAISTQIILNTLTHPAKGRVWPVESLKDVIVDLPPGLAGDPTTVGRCTMDQLAAIPLSCPTSSQVGDLGVLFNGEPGNSPTPLFNMVPPAGVPARFAFSAAGTLIVLDFSLRSDGDYGLTLASKNSSEAFSIVGTKATVWGYPAHPRHNAKRYCPDTGAFGCAANMPVRPFLRNPTACTTPGVGLATTLRVDSWQHPGDFKTASFVSHLPPGFPLPPGDWGSDQGPTNCGDVPFDAALSGSPATPAKTNEPSGFSFDLSIPQDDDAISQSDLKKAVVTLPEGVRVSPPSADGLKGCSPSQIGLDSLGDPSCPNGSKIGSVTIDTPLLEEQVKGSVYLATPNDNPSGTLIGLYIVAKGPGVIVKLPGKAELDPVTGRITATFDDNPQLPFSNLHVEFNDGPRAALVLPRMCGTYTTRAELTGWSGKTVVSESSFTLDQGPNGQACPAVQPFSPDFAAGTVNPVAGGFSPFLLSLSRDDEDQELGSLEVNMPQGILAKVDGVPRCPAARAAAGTCGEDSRVGTVTAGAGAGPNPFYLPGGVYFSGPYKGAPFSLSVVVPAVAGPFDLGKVVVRTALHVDRSSATLKAVSDPLPTILAGIPLQVRDVRVAIDRSKFTLNPTSCAEKQIGATIGSTEGATANVGSRFQVGDCSALRFVPKLGLRLTGRKQVTTGKHPGVKAQVAQTGVGEAGIRKAVVRLPKSLALDPDNANALCEFTDGTKDDLENHCPKGSIVGRARAKTPLLEDELAGNVYFVKNVRKDPRTGNLIRTLPMLVVALRGEIAINLRGTSSTTRGGRLVNTFASVPDAPISRFNLNVNGGRNGILAVTRTTKSRINLCAARQTAAVNLNGQNGKRRVFDVRVKTPCTSKAAAKRKAAARRR